MSHCEIFRNYPLREGQPSHDAHHDGKDHGRSAYFLCATCALFLMVANVAAQPAAVPLDGLHLWVLAGGTITNTGATTINGDLGSGTSVTGTPTPTVTGTSNVNNDAATAAQADLTTAYNNALDERILLRWPRSSAPKFSALAVYNSAGTFG